MEPKNLSIKDDKKEKSEIVEDDEIFVEDWYYINDILTREESEERINKNVSDIITEDPTTTKILPIKEDIKEKLKIVEDDVISVEDWYHINDTLTREESEVRINTLLIFATLVLTLVLLGFLFQILLVLSADNLDLLIFRRSEGK